MFFDPHGFSSLPRGFHPFAIKGQPVGSVNHKPSGQNQWAYAHHPWAPFSRNSHPSLGHGKSASRCDADIATISFLKAPSASLAIPAAISFALFAQLVLVEAGLSQFAAHISPGWSLAGFPVSAAISLAPLAERVLVFAGTPQLLAFPTQPDASRPNLEGLGKG